MNRDLNEATTSTFMDQLEQVSNNATALPKWEGTFGDYLRLFELTEPKKDGQKECKKYPNLGALAHQRVYDMILAAGTEKVDYFGNSRTRYAFFEDYLYGLETSIDEIMSYIASAAQKTETNRRMLLIYGPPSSGKSELVNLIKKGLERYSKTDRGALFGVKGSKLHENPLLLIPAELREEFAERYKVRIEGELSPHTRWRLENEFKGKFMEFPVERILFSEADRVGIGTWLPSDVKCLTSDCLIFTPEGLRRGEDIFLPNQKGLKSTVIGGDDVPTLVNDVFDNGTRPVYQVKMRGMTLKATRNHRFKVINDDGNFEWCEVNDLQGESLPISVNLGVYGSATENKLEQLSEGIYSDRHHAVKTPLFLSDKLARLAGYLISEGYCDSTQISFCNQDNVINEDYRSILGDEFEIHNKINYRNAKKESNGEIQRGVVVSKQKFVDFININFETDKGACEKRVPKCILASCREHCIEFLEGLYTGDGCVYIRETTAGISYSSCSKRLIEDVQMMLVNLGVYGCINSYIDPKYPQNTQYRLTCEGADAIELAGMLPKFFSHRNGSSLWRNQVTDHHTHNYESFGNLHGLIEQIRMATKGTRDIIDRRYTTNTENGRHPSRRALEKWLNHLKSDQCIWVIPEQKSHIVSKLTTILSYRMIPVVSVEHSGYEQVYDIEVSNEEHSFIVNGAISHNSQDISELVGDIDYSKIQKYGDEGDPRAYNFDGELFVANRGVMEFIEGLKCLCGDSRIPTSEGMLKIGDLHGDGKIPLAAKERVCKVSNGFNQGLITRTCYKGVEDCVTITTNRGYELKGSVHHRIKVYNENSGEMIWKEMGDVTSDDRVVMSFDSTWTTSVPLMPSVELFKKHKSRTSLQIGLTLTCDLSRLLGYFVAEGSYSKHGDKKYSVRITNTDKEVLEDISQISKKIGITPHFAGKDIILNSASLCDLFESLGLGNVSHASEKFIPEIVWRAPKKYVANFLSAYFDGDGTVTDNDISCTSASEQLVKEVQMLLLNFGIVSCRRDIWNKKYQRYYYSLTISSDYYDLFLSEIGFNITRKQQCGSDRVQNRINHRDSLPLQSLFQEFCSSLKEVSTELGVPMAPKKYNDEMNDHLISRKTYNDIWAYSNGVRSPSRRSCTRIASELLEVQELGVLGQRLNSFVSMPIFFDVVKSVNSIGRQDVFDVHETSKHSYVSSGFINHNSDEKFLRQCLIATQEKCVKAPRFGLIHVDNFIIMHSNEEEFSTFMHERRYEAYHDRMYIVRMPHNVGVNNEVKIYDKLLKHTDAVTDMDVSPRSLEAAAMFSVLTRLEPPAEGSDFSIIKKMKLYDGQHVRGFKKEQVIDLKKKSKDEGMGGVSPRFIIDQISAAISKSREEGRDFITPLDVLRTLNKGVFNRDSFNEEQKNSFESYIDSARSEWNDMLRNDIQKAFFLEYEKEARALCENYLDQIEAFCSDQLPRDPVTGDEAELDEGLMSAIEDQIDISSSGRNDFRNEILRAVGVAARKELKFDYTQHSQLREGIQKALFEERKGAIRMTVSSRSPDPDALRRLNDVVNRMCEQQGYSAAAANELLKYASAHLFDK